MEKSRHVLSWRRKGCPSQAVVVGVGCSGVLTCCFPHREEFMIPLIPLGLKETKDVDFSVVLKVGSPNSRL